MTRIVVPLLVAALPAAEVSADAVLVSEGSVSAAAAVSASVSVEAGFGVASTLRLRDYPLRPREVEISTPVTPVSEPPVVVVSGTPVSRGVVRLRPGIGVRPAEMLAPAAPTVVVAPAPPPVVTVAPAPTVVVNPPPPPVVTVAPACGCCDCRRDDVSAAVVAEGSSDDDLDLVLLGNYRYLADGDQVGGASLALRLLLTDELSLEAGVGYLAGGTADGRDREEVPTSLSLLWYVAGRDFPLYLGVGAVADWTSVWVDADGCDLDGNADLFRLGGRAALGVEWSFLDTFLLTAEVEAFVREAVEGVACDAGPGTPACTEIGLATNLGLGLRF